MSQVLREDDPLIARARDALAREDWDEAYELLSAADRERALGPDALPLLSEAAYFAAHPEITRKVWERLHTAALRRGDTTAAAEAALQVAFFLIDAGLLEQFRGWSRRAERLLDGLPESALHGVLAMHQSFVSLVFGELDRALDRARRAVELSTRFDDARTLILARVAEARVLVLQGHLQEGLAILDESAVASSSGELDPVTTAYVYCNVVCAWQALAEYERAAEWTRAMVEHSDRHAVGSAHGFCRVHRAEILRLRGECREAEAEARRACEEIRTYSRGDLGWPLNELGQIRLRLGDVAGAETAFLEAHEAGWEPQPGLALVRLAQGNVPAAAAAVRDALETPMAAPSWELPPNNRLRRAPLLAAQAEIALAAGDLDVARTAAAELEEIAVAFGSKAIRAAAAGARGGVEAAEGSHAAARERLQEGVRLWTELSAPYETARARMQLAGVYRAEGNEDRALLELQSARSAFERLGARIDARRAEQAAAALRPLDLEAPREQKAFMFTDIVQSTNLIEVIGDQAWGHLVRWHNETLAALVAEHGGGSVRTTGDGFFVTFDTALDAMRCAVAIQRALDGHRRQHGFSPRVRIGVHLAEATREGDDWRGVGVHAAARIGALADGDEILVSRDTAGAAGEGFAVLDPRTVALKGITDPVEVVAVEWR